MMWRNLQTPPIKGRDFNAVAHLGQASLDNAQGSDGSHFAFETTSVDAVWRAGIVGFEASPVL